MTKNVPSPLPSLVPETAPFTEDQRTWLNGFFAGLISLDNNGVTALSGDQAAALLGGAPGSTEEDDGGAPWHDQTIPLPERMKLAADKPLRWKMMAAMAQQDCGQCGYDCKNYSGAIMTGKEERLNLCVPGGKETARMVKTLFEELKIAPSADKAAPTTDPVENSAPLSAPGTSRDNPSTAKVISRKLLCKQGSLKETWHVEFDLTDSGIEYTVGDAFGLYPSNHPDLADAIIKALDAPPDFPIGGRTLREVLIDGVSLSPAPDMLFQLFSYITGGERRQKARALSTGEDPDGDAETLDVLAAIEKFPGVRPDPEAFIEALDPLQPRLYSISSSPKLNEGRVSLTVDAVRYRIEERDRHGVCSTLLAERIEPGAILKAYVQKAHAFALPADPNVPIIMIGPGTGVAPFRAFLQERQAIAAPGRNWLFFGHQRSDYDFFYEDELKAMRTSGLLSRLTLAWSRDSDQKIYVQDRMRDSGRDLWEWITEGAYIYVCGDAKRMAKDVEMALVDIVAQHGARTPEEASAFVTGLKKSGRYQQDVY